jgi:hypothetical protein
MLAATLHGSEPKGLSTIHEACALSAHHADALSPSAAWSFEHLISIFKERNRCASDPAARDARVVHELAGYRLRLQSPTFDLREITCTEFPGSIPTTSIATRRRTNRRQAGA